MQMEGKKCNLYKLLFLLSIFLFELANYGKNTIIIAPIASILCYIALYISLINLLITTIKLNLKPSKFLTLVVLLLFSCVIYVTTGDYIFMELIALMITAVNLDFSEIIEKDYKIRLIIFALILSCYFLGFVEKDIFYRGSEIRYAFGFNHPNTFAFFILILLWEFLYLNKNKLNIKKILLCLVPAFILLELSDSRSSELAVLAFLALLAVNKTKKSTIKSFITSNLFLIFTIVSVTITVLFNQRNITIVNLNKVLSSRIWMQEYYYLRYPINLLGNTITYDYTIDNVYFKTLINYGIVGTLAMAHIYSSMLKTARKKNDSLVYNFIIVLLFYGLMEWYIIRPVLNIILFYYSSSILDKVGDRND